LFNNTDIERTYLGWEKLVRLDFFKFRGSRPENKVETGVAFNVN